MLHKKEWEETDDNMMDNILLHHNPMPPSSVLSLITGDRRRSVLVLHLAARGKHDFYHVSGVHYEFKSKSRADSNHLYRALQSSDRN